MFIPTPNCARAVINYSVGDEAWSNVLHFTMSDFTLTDQENLAAAVDLAVATHLKGYLAQAARYDNTTVYDIRTSDGAITLNSDGAGVGGQAFDVLPLNVAMVYTLRTASRGRSGRGRVYFAGFGEGSLTAGEWAGSAVTNVALFLQDMITLIPSSGWTFVIRSTQHDGVILTQGVTRPVISAQLRNNKPGTQRRRIDRP